jgi:hypothetical protein
MHLQLQCQSLLHVHEQSPSTGLVGCHVSCCYSSYTAINYLTAIRPTGRWWWLIESLSLNICIMLLRFIA